MAKSTRKRHRSQGWHWLIISVIHVVLAIVLCMIVFELPFKESVIIGIAVYLLMWWLYPLRWYRRIFALMLSFSVVASYYFSVIWPDPNHPEKVRKIVLSIVGNWVNFVCWTAVMITLLILDYKSRKPEVFERGIPIDASSIMRPQLAIVLLFLFIVLMMLLGPDFITE